MSSDEFWDLLGTSEHESLEYKRGAPDATLDAICAMAMTEGGLIVLGVDNQREISGCPLSQHTRDRIMRFADECNVEVQVRAIAVGETECTVIAVPAVTGRVITTPNGRLLRRVGSFNRPLRGDDHARFVMQRLGSVGEDEPAADFGASSIDLPALNDGRKADGRGAVERDGAIRALVDLNVAVPQAAPLDTKVLRAAVVLFASDPTQFVPRAAVQLVRRLGIGPGPGPVTVRKEITGPLVTVLERSLDFIEANTRNIHVLPAESLRRGSRPEYPRSVMREAVMNALAHRDYHLIGSTIDITIWDDRVEILSPGSLPAHITVDNIEQEHYSRNPRMMRVLKTMGLVEEYGEGVDRMISETQAHWIQPPQFVATDQSVTVIVRNTPVMPLEDQAWLEGRGLARLPSDEQRLLVAMRDAGSASRRELEPLSDNIDRLIATTLSKGLLVAIGNRGGRRYELDPEHHLPGARSRVAADRQEDQVLAAIDRAGSVTTRQVAGILGVEMAAARRVLRRLRDAGVVRTEGRTRAMRYLRA